MIGRAIIIVLTVLAAASPAMTRDGSAQPYAGQQARDVTSLSASDLAQIEAGQGWGLAKPAELNGYPGPAHVIELATELKLTTEQRRAVEAIFNAMKAAAIEAGRLYIDAERNVDEVFRSGAATPDQLHAATMAAGERRAALRLTHLEAHISTAALLSEHQRRQYDQLRGYTGAGGHGGHHGHGAHQKHGH